MPQSQRTKSQLTAVLQQVTELAEDSLDPELSREELVRRMKDIANLADDMTDDADSDEDEDDEED